MKSINTFPALLVHLPRAIVAFSGLFIFHLLSGDALASGSMIGLGIFALLARATGSIEKRITRIELSVAATFCLLVYLQGGFTEHYNRLSLPLTLSTGVLLFGLNAINKSAPQLRIVATPLILIVFFVSQRYFYPELPNGFENPLLSIGLLVAAWELLSSLVHAKRSSPSIIETGASLALLIVYYHQSANFPIAAIFSVIILFSYFIGARQRTESTDTGFALGNATQWQTDPIPNRQALKPFAIILCGALLLFLGSGWIVSTQASRFSLLASLESPSKTLQIEQRNRVNQAFLSFKVPQPSESKPLRPLDINILEEALKQSIKTKSQTPKRRVVIRQSPNSESGKLNVGDRDREPIQVTRISKIPALRITAPKATQSLPEYKLVTNIIPEIKMDATRSINYDFGIAGPSEENEIQSENPEVGPSGGPIRLQESTSPSAVESDQAQRNRPARRSRSNETAPRDVQASVGFSSALEYGDNVSIKLKSRPVLEVYLPGSAKWRNGLYLRFNVLEQIENDRFTQAAVSSNKEQTILKPGWNEAPEAFQSHLESDDPWTLVLGYDWKTPIPLLGPFRSIRIPEGTTLSANGDSFSIQRRSGSGPFAYQFQGIQISNTRALNGLSPLAEERERLTELPLRSKEIAYLKRLGTRIAGKSSSTEMFAKRVGIYFENAHPYAFDFKFKSSDEPLLISWLKSRSPGICGYYAGAFTLLARARGIPSRVVVGALTREFDSKSRKFIVRDRDAHAWAEYLNENGEWVRADLTPIALGSPRFAPVQSNSEHYANNVQSALEALGSETSPAVIEPHYAYSGVSTLTEKQLEHATSNSAPSPSEIVPSAATLIDSVLQNEKDLETAILARTTELVPPLDLKSDASLSPLPVLPSREPDEPVSIPLSTEVSTLVETANATAAQVDPDWTWSPRVAINYLFILLLIVFAASQLSRTRKVITRSKGSGSHAIRERTLAGRLLREIDLLCGQSDNDTAIWQGFRQRALRLRYSPECSLQEIKSLKREFQSSLGTQNSGT